MTSPPEHPGWRVQLAVHRAVRRDVRRLWAALAEGRDTPPAAIRSYWKVTAEQLHHHHELEDTLAVPMMRERLGPSFDALFARNVQEHVVMAIAMDKFDTVLSTTTDPAPARLALEQMDRAIELHLSHEEADVLPLVPESLSIDDVGDISAEAAKLDPPEVFLPWLLDDAPKEDLAYYTVPMPDPMRSAFTSTWLPERQKLVDALRLADTAVTAG